MPTLDQVRSWVEAGESEILEFKRTTGTRRSAIMTLCAMLNTRGGRLLIGVEPGGAIIGQQVSDHTIEQLAQEIREIDSPAFPSIERVPIGNGLEVITLAVMQGPNRPYAFRGKSYQRVGNTTTVMTRDEHNRMLMERLHSDRRWENDLPLGGVSRIWITPRSLGQSTRQSVAAGKVTQEPGILRLYCAALGSFAMA